MKKYLSLFIIPLLIVMYPGLITGQEEEPYDGTVEYTLSRGEVRIVLPEIIMRGLEKKIYIEFIDARKAQKIEGRNVLIILNKKHIIKQVKDSKIVLAYNFQKKEVLQISSGGFYFSKKINPIPLWLSVVPPLVAILIALLFKEVFTALVIGIFLGAGIIYLFKDISIFTAISAGLLAVIDTYVVDSLVSRDHVPIIVFSMLIGAMVNLISANGGMQGVVNYLSRFAKEVRSGAFVTWLMGILIFFDDYANTLVVGNTMRPVTDRLRISREKLSYIVDSTAAPISAIAFVTTWIGAELGYIQNGIAALGLDESPYIVFIHSLQYSFYPVFALLFIPMLIRTGRDYGPMYTAEVKARNDYNHNLSHDNRDITRNDTSSGYADVAKARWYNAIVPIAIVIAGTMVGLVYTGLQKVTWNAEFSLTTNISNIIGHSDSFNALLWSSFLGVITSVVMTVAQGILPLRESVNKLVDGFKTMITAILILVLAWSLALVTEHLHTAEYISQLLVSIKITPFLIPALTFIIAALISFSTGSSWGTMAILYPLILPASWLISVKSGMPEDTAMSIFHNVVSAVLAGSVFGDHCSPISDTTILSSLASSCKHIEHVRTQLPYAITIGLTAIFIGTIPAAYGVPAYLLIPAGLAILYLIIILFGKKVAL